MNQKVTPRPNGDFTIIEDEKLDSGMFHTKKSIISEHYGFTPELLESIGSASLGDVEDEKIDDEKQ